ncbi:hypothetical protein BDZ94DRAFT_1260094 [Collybia nuda]|uniref:C2H2-type domain-containing protein n=1 Tax=Collybia nuda TaxID=64659 RepID=A0A9P5Y7T6_9AGAR|nr:hypothetical protein BDZ94DRAFT_1260094 [Collybia nuda]
MSCHGRGSNLHCDLICDGTTNCTDCNGFDDFLQCCTDYHSYIVEPRTTEPEHSGNFSWDPSFDEFLCACGIQESAKDVARPLPGSPASQTPRSSSYPPLTNNEPTFSPGTHVITSHTILSTRISTPVTTSGSSPTIADATLACMWGNCQAQFTSLTNLVGHVNLEHLQPSPGPIVHSTTGTTHSDTTRLSCLWRDCDIYSSPESIPGSSSGNHVDEVLSILAHHLLNDHLGLSTYDQSTYGHRLDTPEYTRNSTIAQAHPGYLTPPTDPSLHSDSPSQSPPPKHLCSGTHRCQWKDCGHTFTTCDDLTSHITALHVGAGKAQYECFWEGCNRNGNRGFSSKQKICRHLQSHTGHRPYQCNICHQNFSEAATLQQHRRRHTQEKPYKCDYPGCEKSFAITGALTIHKRIHNGHKPFKCKFCDRAFAESSNLSKHLRTHTGARPYICTEPGCTKAFARPDQLTRHLGVHRKKNVLAEPQEDSI